MQMVQLDKLHKQVEVLTKAVQVLAKERIAEKQAINDSSRPETHTASELLESAKDIALKRYGGRVSKIWNTKFLMTGVTVEVIPFVAKKGKYKGKICLKTRAYSE